ncbi:hypothetical protein G7046_g7817 [Stylonectria norvegica]|nr:hypothetical protein G7046_g7817 [Stylonectria norvegica]
MKFTASALVLAAALGVSAHPSGHAHARYHDVRRDFVVANKPVTVTEYATAPAVAAPTVAPVAPVVPVANSVSSKAVVVPSSSSAAAPKSSASSTAGSGSGYKAFCGGASSKRATVAEIAYKGNVGTSANYGCNLMVVDSSVADKYKHTVTFKNAAKSAQECACWNKIGPDGGINGFFTGNEAISFSLSAGGSAVVAVDDNSQVRLYLARV